MNTIDNPKLEKGRSDFRARLPDWYHGWAHLAATIALALGLVIYSISMLENVHGLEWLTIPLTFLYVNLFEYLGHRWPMHRPIRFLKRIYRRHSLEHHRFFDHQAMHTASHRDFYAVLFAPVLVVFFGLAFVFPAWWALAFFATQNVAWLFTAVVFAYFLNYELLHLAYHQAWCSRVPLIAMLARHHCQHHNPAWMNKCNFNVTYPIADTLFGTKYKN